MQMHSAEYHKHSQIAMRCRKWVLCALTQRWMTNDVGLTCVLQCLLQRKKWSLSNRMNSSRLSHFWLSLYAAARANPLYLFWQGNGGGFRHVVNAIGFCTAETADAGTFVVAGLSQNDIINLSIKFNAKCMDRVRSGKPFKRATNWTGFCHKLTYSLNFECFYFPLGLICQPLRCW